MEIKNVALIGLGAMGVFFAPRMEEHLGRENFCVIAEGKRKERLETCGVTVNGVNHKFPICIPEDGTEKDLIIMAVKDSGLDQAIDDIKNFVGEKTQILCVMNGVESENRVAAVYGWDHVLYSYMRMSIVMKDGKADFNPYWGKVYFGEARNEKLTERVQAVKNVMEKCDIPYRIDTDMIQGIWFKYMCNVGENLTCALLQIPFGGFRNSKAANNIRWAAMKEVQAVARAKGITITDEQMEKQYETIGRIPFHNKPSTLQDLEAKRKTEIEMFAGTMVKMGEELGIATPICFLFQEAITVLEEKNTGILQEEKLPSAKRLEKFETGIFASLDEKKQQLEARGRQVYNLSVGTPDFEPPLHIVEALKEAVEEPENYKYSLVDSEEMLDAVVQYYEKRYHTSITKEEVTAVHGTQEGMGHLGMALCNPGDVVLLPDPGYPIFTAGSCLGEAEIYYYPLLEENGYLPVLKDIPEEVLYQAKYMVLSYPSNPVGAVAPRELYETLIEYARKYKFYIINDNAYSDIIFDGREGGSFLSLPGAKEVGVEFFSLSKSFNITGLRISFCIGNVRIIEALKLLRSQFDFGISYPVQKAAIAALTGPLDGVKKQCLEYQRRRDALCDGLRQYGWKIRNSQGTMFVWLSIPKGVSSVEFCEELLEKTGVVATPGTAFGKRGNGYIRLALVQPAEKLAEIAKIIGEWKNLNLIRK